jgi:hypothetical protein
MYQSQSLLEAYYSIYKNESEKKEYLYQYVTNYILENFNFENEEHFYEMLELIDDEMITDIVVEGAKDMSDEDIERYSKQFPEPHRKAVVDKLRAKRAEKQQPKKEEKPSRTGIWAEFQKDFDRQKETRQKSQADQKKPENPLRKTTMNTQGSSQRKKGPDLPNFRR